MTDVRFAVRAEEDAARITAWWRLNRPSAPSLFVDELAEAVEQLARLPAIGAPYPTPDGERVRRLFLRRTRFHLYYVQDETTDAVEVLAICGSTRGRRPPLSR